MNRSPSLSKGPRRVVLATHNPHKVEEFQAIVAATRPDLEVIGYDGPEPVEDGVTFAENALIKARAAAAHTGLPALADDSGICVDVLGGAPGVFSAYWAGHAKDAGANLNLLLDQLADIRDPHRAAQFVSTIALVVPPSASSGTGEAGSGTGEAGSGTGEAGSGTGEAGSGTGEAGSRTGEAGSGTAPSSPEVGSGAVEHVVQGVWPGRLAMTASGGGGFGYDPVFIPDGQPDGAERTVGEWTAEEKNAASHRSRAFAALAPLLAAL